MALRLRLLVCQLEMTLTTPDDAVGNEGDSAGRCAV